MIRRTPAQEKEFQKAYQELIEAVHDTEGMDPDKAEETQRMLLGLIKEMFGEPQFAKGEMEA